MRGVASLLWKLINIGKDIADAVDRLNGVGFAKEWLQPASQILDMGVNGAISDRSIGVVQMVEQLLA